VLHATVSIDRLGVVVVRSAAEGKEDVVVAWAQTTALARHRTGALAGLRPRDGSASWLWSSSTSEVQRGLHSESGTLWLLLACSVFDAMA
jgi:hypothetical protein